MKTLPLPKPVAVGSRRTRRAQAFTLAEMMIAAFIFVFMVLGIIYTWLFGLRYDELVCSKLGSTDVSRMSFDQLIGDIHSAKWWKVGNGTAASFTACTNAMNQVGNALRVSANGNTNSTAYVTYYFDTNQCQLCRVTNGVATIQILAQNLTNASGSAMQFQAQQFNGSLAQDWQFKYNIWAKLEFCQYQYPLTKVGPGYYYNYYGIQIMACSHCPN
jgi:hypothetical protein